MQNGAALIKSIEYAYYRTWSSLPCICRPAPGHTGSSGLWEAPACPGRGLPLTGQLGNSCSGRPRPKPCKVCFFLKCLRQSNRETGSRGWRWNIPEILETLRRRSVHHTVDATPDTQDSTMNSNGHDRFCSQERMMVNTKLKMISRRATTGEHTMQYTGGILLNCALETCIVLLTNVTLKKFLNVNKNRRM